MQVNWKVQDWQKNKMYDSVAWREQYIFGSSRLGLYRADTLVNKGLQTISKLYEGKRNYELTNHLGNVLAVINDRKTDSLSATNVKLGYNAVVISATDYYPFGMSIDSRSYTSSLYRYGFNGKENDKETGEQDYGMRIYDPRIGKFLSVDPLTKKYPWYTPYQFAGNMPIWAVDLDGLEPGFKGSEGQIATANHPTSSQEQTFVSLNGNWSLTSVSQEDLLNADRRSRTFFSPGANYKIGVDTYVEDWGKELQKGGISSTFVPTYANFPSAFGDRMYVLNFRNYVKAPLPQWNEDTKTFEDNGITLTPQKPIDIANVIKNNLSNNNLKPGEQINLMGTSYGSVVMAQAALQLADNGIIIDNVILIASPVSTNSELFRALSSNNNIKRVIRADIPGDYLSNPDGNIKVARLLWDELSPLGGKHHHKYTDTNLHREEVLNNIDGLIKEWRKMGVR